MSGKATDITIEIFNHCSGTCTGCMLSINERKEVYPVMRLKDFEMVMDKLVEWERQTGLNYRCVLVFGDVPWLPLEVQEQYYRAVTDRGMGLGVTMTMVDDNRTEHYARSTKLIREADHEAIFDLTVDPVRLERNPDYAKRCRDAIASAHHVHLAILLSEAILTRYSPEALSDLCQKYIGDDPVSLGFTPTLTNLARKNYSYEVTSAADYAVRFYQSTEGGAKHLERELDRYDAVGDHADFLKQTCHISGRMDVYPVAYTIWGDVILDDRNGGRSLGKLSEEQGLDALVSNIMAKRHSIDAVSWMSRGEFGCEECEFLDSCSFNGIGVARKLYREFESKTGSCYGPRDVMSRLSQSVYEKVPAE
ncbi:MAG: hypothetical protein KI792_08540 [Alphaproteobacteria bacterium]|nr:hypothetical protein [Alphaproteobacteria bacterium SS10]